MLGRHDTPLVALSVILAVLASYTALALAARVTIARDRARLAWLPLAEGQLERWERMDDGSHDSAHAQGDLRERTILYVDDAGFLEAVDATGVEPMVAA